MRATYVSPKLTPATPEQAAAAFRQACLDLWGTGRAETVATLMAQSALESGHWRAMYNWNPSNIKCENTRPGFYTCLSLINEVVERNGKPFIAWFTPQGELAHKGGPLLKTALPVPEGHPQTRFRAYESFSDGAKDKLTFLQRPRYNAALEAALGGSPGAYSRACSAAGYYTAPVDTYTRTLVALYSKYLPMLTGADANPVELSPADEDAVCAGIAECIRTDPDEFLRRRVDAAQIPHQDLVDWSRDE